MAHKAAFVALLFAASLAFSGCSGESDNPASPAQAPDLTGTWDLFVEIKVPEAMIWLDITDDNGVLTGNYVHLTGSIPLNGTCDTEGGVHIVFEQKDPDIGIPFKGILEGKATADRSVINGTLTVVLPESDAVAYAGPFFAGKR